MIMKSILDNDLYKFSTGYCYMKCFPYMQGEFTFMDRNKTLYDEDFVQKLKTELYALAGLKLTKEEKKWCIANIPYIPPFYWGWLESFRYDASQLNIELVDIVDGKGHLSITAKGPICEISMWEIPVLATVSELYYKNNHKSVTINGIISKLKPKVAISNDNQMRFSEFGTRRRFSFLVQDTVCEYLSKNASYCTGTSNVYLAMKHGMKPIGTFPHELPMGIASQFGYKHANYLTLEKWVETYDGNLGIALADTYTSKLFFQNFSMKHAKLFDGVRQDSGSPFDFTRLAIDRYNQLGIDPMSKTIVFSDSLDFTKALEIQNHCKGRIKCAFGIGTNLTNDTEHKPMNIVMKLTKCAMTAKAPWYNCVKLSDVAGKHMGVGVEQCITELGI